MTEADEPMLPSQRIIIIRKSMRVFQCGLASLLPVIGLIPAAWALVGSWQISRVPGFNPGRRYARWGSVFAILGIFITVIFALSVFLAQIDDPNSYP